MFVFLLFALSSKDSCGRVSWFSSDSTLETKSRNQRSFLTKKKRYPDGQRKTRTRCGIFFAFQPSSAPKSFLGQISGLFQERGKKEAQKAFLSGKFFFSTLFRVCGEKYLFFHSLKKYQLQVELDKEAEQRTRGLDVLFPLFFSTLFFHLTNDRRRAGTEISQENT